LEIVMRMSLFLVAAALVPLTASRMANAAPSAAAPQSPGSAVVAASFDSHAAVAAIRRILNENYVLPEVRPPLDAALAKSLAAGTYDVDDPAVFAERVNADLKAVAHDKHLNLRFDPETAARLAAQPAGDGPDKGPSKEDVRDAQRLAHGIPQMKLLPGNIRYIETTGFIWVGPASAAAYDDAMRFLKAGDAAIIDLRGNGGGDAQAVQYMISHFLAPNRPLMSFYRSGKPVAHTASLPKLPAGRMVGKPLYVLTSQGTGSAAEEFAGHVAGYKLGELIGDSTAGAGFNNTFFPIPGGLALSVSIGRAVLASTGKNWEGVGIAPTTKVPVDQALEVAEAHALRRLEVNARPSEKREIEAAAAVLEAAINPVATALPAAGYAGTYGERKILADGVGLVFQRGEGPKRPLIAIKANTFAMKDDPLTQISFQVANGKATAMDLTRSDGSRLSAARTQ
jgi:hypothetical protein